VQLAALPADEILVRASDQPTATPDELLRAAQAATKTNSEELLRANVVQAGQDQPAETMTEQWLGR